MGIYTINLNTTDLTGEYEDNHFIVTRGDSRIAMIIARNSLTVKFDRMRRFLIDDPDSEIKLAYALTKPLKLGWSFNNEGTFKFVLQEINSTDDDNVPLGIADYYKHFPKTTSDPASDSDGDNTPGGEDEGQEGEGKKVWL